MIYSNITQSSFFEELLEFLGRDEDFANATHIITSANDLQLPY